MKPRIQFDMILKSVDSFADTPGLSEEAVDICARARRRVIEGKQWIKSDFSQFSLAGYAASLSFDSDMTGVGQSVSNQPGILRTFVRVNDQSWRR